MDPGEKYWSNFAKSAPNIKLTILYHARHSAWIDDPAGFNKALNAAL